MNKIVFGHRAPEYLPDLAFCAFMDGVDRFYVDTTLQYSRQSHQNRARIRTPDGMQWITVPVRGGQFGRSIAETEIDYRDNWVRKHEKAFRFNYGSAPFYHHYAPPLLDILQSRPSSLGGLTVDLLMCIHSYLGVSSELVVGGLPYTRRLAAEKSASSMDDAYSDSDLRDSDRPPGEVPLEGVDYVHPAYRQNFGGFIPGMSIIDLLFNAGPDALHVLRSGRNDENEVG